MKKYGSFLGIILLCVAALAAAQPARMGMGGGMRGGGMMGGMGMGRGGGFGAGVFATGVIDPPPGAAFRDPAELAASRPRPGTAEVRLEAGWTVTGLDGLPVTLLTFNGSYPSPTIRARRGEKLVVRFRNSLPPGPLPNSLGHDLSITNLHTHGLHVSPSGSSDNSMIAVRPGEEFVYEFDLSRQEPGTLNYYHPHAHGTVAEQVWAGLGGALVVEDGTEALAGYETHLLVLKDIELSAGGAGAAPLPYRGPMDFMRGRTGGRVMVNGQVNPVLAMRSGQVQRWRVLNASTARFYRLALEGQPLWLIGTDGGLLDRPYRLEELLLSPGERADLLVQGAAAPGRYRLLSLPAGSMMGGMSGMGGMGGMGGVMHGGNEQVTLLTVDCAPAAGAPGAADVLPAVINRGASRVAMSLEGLPRRRLVLGMGMGMGMAGGGFINGISFSEQGSFTVRSRLGTWEVWEVVNESPMSHPFHHHTNAAQVLAVSGGDAEYARLYTTLPAWKDTTIVPAWGRITLLMPVLDYAGMAMFHCHILEHEDIGMMGTWEIE